MQWAQVHTKKHLLGSSTVMELETLSKLYLSPLLALLSNSAGLVCEGSILVGTNLTTSSTGVSVTKVCLIMWNF
jgi:hypothetical protein